MSFRAIGAVTRSLGGLLQAHMAEDPTLAPFFDAGLGGTMVVSPRTPQEMDDGNLSGLSVWLYRICRDPELLNRPPRRVAPDRFEPERLPLRLHYLMTPVVNEDGQIGNDPGLEQFIIGKVLQTFHDHPTLRGPDLLGVLAGSPEAVTIRLEHFGLEEITRVWDALGATYQLCISYEVSFAMIASDTAVEAVSPVESVGLEMAAITGRAEA
jgi:hypothetical protein